MNAIMDIAFSRIQKDTRECVKRMEHGLENHQFASVSLYFYLSHSRNNIMQLKCYPIAASDDVVIPSFNNIEQCQGPPAISHANIAPAKNVHNQGSSVHYACDVGYRLEGTSQRRCGPNGKWAGTEPSCVCAVALMNGKKISYFVCFVLINLFDE